MTEHPSKPLVCRKNEANRTRIEKVSKTERESERKREREREERERERNERERESTY